MQARFYDPMLGRFLSADTIVPEPGKPQSLNRYSYVYNRPLMYNDPTGHQGGGGWVPLDMCGREVNCGDAGPQLSIDWTVLPYFPIITEEIVEALPIGPLPPPPEPPAANEGGGQGAELVVILNFGGGAAVAEPTIAGEVILGAAVAGAACYLYCADVAGAIASGAREAACALPFVHCADGGDEAASPRRTVSPERREHILGSDETGGGHRPGTGISGNTEFPREWSDDQIIEAIESVANDPGSSERTQQDGRIVVEGTRRGVDIRVIVEPNSIDIVTGFPTNVPRNP